MISNIWTTKEYKNEIETLFAGFDVFEVDRFFETHQFKDADEQTEENTQDHDITIVDEITFDVFLDHISCYFSKGV